MSTDKFFTYDGITSQDFGVYVLDVREETFTRRDIDKIPVSGRSGDLLSDLGRYDNIIVTYVCAFAENGDYGVRELNAALLSKNGYNEIHDSYYPDYYRVGYFTGGLKPKISRLDGKAVVEYSFDCKPQRYLVSGDTVSFTIEGTGHPSHIVDEGRMADVVSNKFVDMMGLLYPNEYITVLGSFSGNDRVANVYYPKHKIGHEYVFGTSNVSPTSESYAGGISGNSFINAAPMNPASYNSYFHFSTPSRWEVYEEDTLVDALFPDSMMIYNPTQFPSSPLIQIHTGGAAVSNRAVLLIGDSESIRVNVGSSISHMGETISVEDIFIDCDTMNAYMIYGDAVINMNPYVMLPDRSITLEAGENIIYTNDWIEYAKITPRWWTL